MPLSRRQDAARKSRSSTDALKRGVVKTLKQDAYTTGVTILRDTTPRMPSNFDRDLQIGILFSFFIFSMLFLSLTSWLNVE
jgi:hypothetical protein